MPQFVMNESDDPDFTSLDEFTQGYIQALFFTECEGSIWDGSFDPENGSQLPDEAGFLNLTPETLERIKTDCASFQEANAENLKKALGHKLHNGNHYDSEQAGMDFWYCRHGHGVGYWDRGLGDVGEELSKAARACGETYVYWEGENEEGTVNFG